MTLETKLTNAIQSRNTDKITKVFEQIYAKYCNLVGYIISKYVPRHADAEELVNDVFASFSREMFRTPIRNVKYFLVTCAKNAAVNFVRRNSGGQVTYAEGISQDELSQVAATQAAPFWEFVADLQNFLSEQEAEIVVQHAVFGYTFVELAQKYNCPPTTVNSTYHRAIKKYKKGIKNETSEK